MTLQQDGHGTNLLTLMRRITAARSRLVCAIGLLAVSTLLGCTSGVSDSVQASNQAGEEDIATASVTEPSEVARTSAAPGPPERTEQKLATFPNHVQIGVHEIDYLSWSDFILIKAGLDRFAIFGEEYMCVFGADNEISSCEQGLFGGRSAKWSPSGKLIMVETITGAAVPNVYPIDEDGIIGTRRPIDPAIQFIDWAGDDDTIIARVDGYLAYYSIRSGVATRIGDVPTPYGATLVGDWLWYGADRAIVALHSSGFEQRFDLGDRFYTSATSSSGDTALVYLQGPAQTVFVLDAIAGSSRAINLPDDVTNSRVTMSPDGVTLLATTSYYPNSGLLGADLTTGAVELDWVVLEQDVEISLAGFIWESSTHLRSGNRTGLLDIHLITTS